MCCAFCVFCVVVVVVCFSWKLLGWSFWMCVFFFFFNFPFLFLFLNSLFLKVSYNL